VEGPKVPRSYKRAPTPEQVDALAGAMEDRYRAWVYLVAYTGLRPGESYALRVDDFDEVHGTIRVDEGLRQVGGMGPTKTDGSSRTVPIPPSVARMLSEYMAEYPPNDDGLIFTSPSGQAINAGNFRRRYFDKAAQAAGVPWLTPNSLRHAGASFMRLAGGMVEEVSRRLGHSRTSVTMDVYADVFREADEQVTAGLDTILSNSRSQAAAAFSLPHAEEATIRTLSSGEENA
jgi:integrase